MRQAHDIELCARHGNLRLKGLDQGATEARRRVEHLLGKLRKGREVDLREAEAILLGPAGAATAEPTGERSTGAVERGWPPGGGSSAAVAPSPRYQRAPVG